MYFTFNKVDFIHFLSFKIKSTNAMEQKSLRSLKIEAPYN